jgi:DNA polymerase-3 subunit gamma/tau
MEPFIVSALKYRPQTFKDVVGQSAITNTLKNAIDQNHLAQALLFTGPRGVGKTTCARILAKMINSEGAESENEDFAFNIFELDAASNNSVDDIRSLTDQVRIPPQVGNYKVYIIDEVHMLSASAFNAFLKTLEEPPKHCIFILATTEKHKIIPTILSRCQIFDFKRINVTDAKNYLKVIAEEQGITADDDALHIIAQKADGAMRDALSIFDRVVSFSGKNLTRQAVTENLNVLDYDTFFGATDLILANKIPDLLLHFNLIISKGFDGHHFITGLASHFRDLLVSKTPQTIELIEVGDDTKAMYKAQSESTSQAFLIQAIELANDCDLKYKTSKNQRLLVELCLMQLASINFDGEKKKPSGFIIPASYFRSKSIPEVKITQPESTSKTTTQEQKKELTAVFQKIEEPQTPYPKKELPTPVIKSTQRPTSGLSLSSIRKKKEHQIKLMEVTVDE